MGRRDGGRLCTSSPERRSDREMPTPDEMLIIRALKKIDEGDRWELMDVMGGKWLGGQKKIEYLCHYLRRQGLVREVGRKKGRNRYALTPKGQAVMSGR